jgi:hypothetical protein
MHQDAPYFIILLCLMPDDFTRQMESASTQWVRVLGRRLSDHPMDGHFWIRTAKF